MKILRFLYLLPLVAACSTENPSSGPVGLVVGFEKSFGTKAGITAEAYKDSIPSSTNPLMADIWFSTTANTFPGSGTVSTTGDVIDVHTTISYYGPTLTIPDPYTTGKYVHYPPAHGNIYCVGLYPQGAWAATDGGTTATATIDGEKDLMYADQKEGNDNNALSKSRQLYNHELTWVKIRVRSSEHTTGETWGKIKSIKVKSASQAKVNFSTNNVEYSGEQLITAFDSTGVEMPIMSTEFGSIFVSPTTEGKYYVDLVCENHHKEGIEILLTDNDGETYSGSTKGKVFVLTLYFKTLPTVDFTVSLSAWEDEGRTLVLN